MWTRTIKFCDIIPVALLLIAGCCQTPTINDLYPPKPMVFTSRGTSIVVPDGYSPVDIHGAIEASIERMIEARPIAEQAPWDQLRVYIPNSKAPIHHPGGYLVINCQIKYVKPGPVMAFRWHNTVYVPMPLVDLSHEITHWLCEYETGKLDQSHTWFFKREDVIRMIAAGAIR